MAELTIQEAAASLGVGVDVVRRRIMANQLKTCRDPQGRTLVVLPGAVGAAAAAGAQPAATPSMAVLPVPAAPDPRLDVVVALQSEISFLRSELEVRDEEMRRRDVIIAQLTQRLPRRLAPPFQSPTVVEAVVTTVQRCVRPRAASRALAQLSPARNGSG